MAPKLEFTESIDNDGNLIQMNSFNCFVALTKRWAAESAGQEGGLGHSWAGVTVSKATDPERSCAERQAVTGL